MHFCTRHMFWTCVSIRVCRGLIGLSIKCSDCRPGSSAAHSCCLHVNMQDLIGFSNKNMVLCVICGSLTLPVNGRAAADQWETFEGSWSWTSCGGSFGCSFQSNILIKSNFFSREL